MNAYIGHPGQLAGFLRYRFTEGAMDGLEAVEVYNETGLRFTVLLGRGMDIGPASYKGLNLSYLAASGMTSAVYYQNGGKEWKHSFTGGLLYTCGLCNVGPDGVMDDGVAYGQHGRYTSLTAEQVCLERIPQDGPDGDILEVRGLMRQGGIFGENFTLRRKIRTYTRKNVIEVEDDVCNNAFERAPLMLMYHCNYGYPLLSEQAVLSVNAAQSLPRDEEAAKGEKTMFTMLPPQPGYAEQVFFHKGADQAALRSPAATVRMSWDAQALPCFTQWNMFGQGEYVLGLEPGNCHPVGRAAYLASPDAEYLEPGQVKHTRLCFAVEDGGACPAQ
ncbi:MAG TPA: aldose 1-epimerase family protein [Firmicutes bacterium]|nr:aldose 1-epimerase family protein [Bacillota bacterium]